MEIAGFLLSLVTMRGFHLIASENFNDTVVMNLRNGSIAYTDVENGIFNRLLPIS